jgi:hypothetical protein
MLTVPPSQVVGLNVFVGLVLINGIIVNWEFRNFHIPRRRLHGTWPNRLVAVPGGFGIKVQIQRFPVEMFYALRQRAPTEIWYSSGTGLPTALL